ncbi:DUF982 domain-containing protein [Mesorhizobium sp. 1M-11]|uniref:DUF982 domain-containing protein n=1 Tax=Mesorhizobium sp. 1M-11 TaxID=1529006 RepID=UPI0006C773B2|nr:DUF982 domain-containing protein [Mesorhizobium sp. 1M-11]
MTPFDPVMFRTARGYEFSVSSLPDVAKAIAMAWPDKECELYRNAARLAERAREGWCTPKAAYDAFLVAAREQGRIVLHRKARERTAGEPAAVGSETWLSAAHLAGFRTRSVRKSVRANKPHV